MVRIKSFKRGMWLSSAILKMAVFNIAELSHIPYTSLQYAHTSILSAYLRTWSEFNFVFLSKTKICKQTWWHTSELLQLQMV